MDPRRDGTGETHERGAVRGDSLRWRRPALWGALLLVGLVGFRVVAGREDPPDGAPGASPTESPASEEQPTDTGANQGSAPQGDASRDTLALKFGPKAAAGDAAAARELAAEFLDLQRIWEERPLEPDEGLALVYVCYYLCQENVALETLGLPQDRLGLTRTRRRAAEHIGRESGVLSALTDEFRLLKNEQPVEAREKLRSVIQEFEHVLPGRPEPLLVLYRNESISDAMRTVEPLALRLLNEPGKTTDPGSRAVFHGLLADLYIRLGNTEEAASHVDKEAQQAKLSGKPAARLASAYNRVALYLANARMEAASRYISSILDEDWIPKHGRDELHRKRGLARAELYRKNPALAEQALPDLDKAIASSLIGRPGRSTALASKTLLLHRLGRLDAVKPAYEHLVREVKALEAEDQVVPSDVACIVGLMGSRLSEAPVAEIRDNLESHVLALFDRALRLNARPGGAGFLHFGSQRDLIGELIERCIEAEPGQAGLERALGWIVRSQALGSMARQEGYEYQGLDGIRKSLTGPSRGVLVYIPASLKTHVFGIDANQLWHETVERAWMLEKVRGEYLHDGLYTSERGERYATLAQKLADVILPESVRARMANWTEVSIGGLSLTDYIPYELLPFDGDQLFGERFQVAYLPSLPIGEVLGAREVHPRPAGTPPIALFVAPTTPEGLEREFPPILLSPEQMKHIGADRGRDVRTWDGDRATFANLREAAASGASILHLFLHGDSRPNRVRPSGLLFAESQDSPARVSCLDIESLERVPPIVILSVCGAQRGPTRKGEDGLTHLGGAFLAAGARTVVLSPDDLEVNGTLELVGHLQNRLLRGEAPAIALAGAVRDLRQDPKYDDPKYASMHVMGLGFQAP